MQKPFYFLLIIVLFTTKNMDGSVKNLLEAEREAQKIITAAETERAAKLEAA